MTSLPKRSSDKRYSIRCNSESMLDISNYFRINTSLNITGFVKVILLKCALLGEADYERGCELASKGSTSYIVQSAVKAHVVPL